MAQKHFKALRIQMIEKGLTGKALSEMIGMKYYCLANRLSMHTPFTLREAYAIMDALELPYEHFATYFRKEEII